MFFTKFDILGGNNLVCLGLQQAHSNQTEFLRWLRKKELEGDHQ